MRHWTEGGAAAIAAMLIATGPAGAEITAAEAWQGIVDYYASMGQSVTAASQGQEGDTLVVRGAEFATHLPEGDARLSVEEIRLKEMGDGRVEVTMSPDIPLSVKMTSSKDEAIDMAMKLTQSGMTFVISGDNTATDYTFNSATMGIDVESLTVNGEAVPMTISGNLANLAGAYHMVKDGTTRQISSDFSSDKLDFAMKANDPKGEGSLAFEGTLNGLSGTGKATLIEGINSQDLLAMLNAGMSIDTAMNYGASAYTFDFHDKADAASGNASGAGGSFHMTMSKDGLRYGGQSSGDKVSMQIPQMPPVDFSIGEAAFDMLMPVTASDQEQPFSFLIKIADLEVSEMLWGLFDPGQKLPRDPATLIIDAAGMAKLDINIFDPANAERLDKGAPGEVSAVKLNQLRVTAVGADLTGDGDVTLDNSGPKPKPLGAVNLKLVGGNALIDKLVEMGLIPQDQAMGARMMLGLFAVPEGEDTLTSKIEFKEDGGIYANGQRIQ
ncbi:MAG: DUF2125 domain-containing protein [Defluviimonas sp.]|uniref:DUF2125 domain-containing protein n=1 Tax=Albidovulum sp. TaxID=1872424 RepID=UPI002A2CB387|nr:DUF2125 domain-containing protein [Defluviimonas sp.]